LVREVREKFDIERLYICSSHLLAVDTLSQAGNPNQICQI